MITSDTTLIPGITADLFDSLSASLTLDRHRDGALFKAFESAPSDHGKGNLDDALPCLGTAEDF